MQCPKCKQELAPTGQVESDGEELVVYQCDDCTSMWNFDGQEFETALTFAVDRQGRFLNPESLEPINLN